MSKSARLIYDGPSDVVEEIIKWTDRVKASGHLGECAVCGGTIHVAQRRLRLAHVLALRHISDLGGIATSAQMKTMASGAAPNDYSYLKHWGLLSQVERGEWRLTGLGRRFLAGEVDVPAFLLLENNEVRGRSQESVVVSDLIDAQERFSRDEVMRAWNPEAAPESAQQVLAL